MDDSEFLRDVIARKLSDDDCPAWADRVEQIAEKLHVSEREQEKKSARERLKRASGTTS